MQWVRLVPLLPPPIPNPEISSSSQDSCSVVAMSIKKKKQKKEKEKKAANFWGISRFHKWFRRKGRRFKLWLMNCSEFHCKLLLLVIIAARFFFFFKQKDSNKIQTQLICISFVRDYKTVYWRMLFFCTTSHYTHFPKTLKAVNHDRFQLILHHFFLYIYFIFYFI